MIYSQLHSWMNNELRYHFPTVIAQRYGTSSLEPQQLPQSNMSVEYHYSFNMQINGLLCDAENASPSHKINIKELTILTGAKSDKNSENKVLLLNLKQHT